MTKTRLVECPTCRGYGAEVDGTYPCGQCNGVGKVKARKKPGRPPRAGAPAMERVEFRATSAELASWAGKANREHLTLSEWIRRKCNKP